MPRRYLAVAPLATVLVTLLSGCAPDANTAPPFAAPASAIRTDQVMSTTSVLGAASASASGNGAVRVIEYGGIFAIVTNDPRRQLTSTLGATIDEVVGDCNGIPFDADPFTYRTLTTPSGKLMEYAQAEDISVLVWDGYYDFDTDFCAFVEDTPLLAVGTADYIITGNNFGAPPGAPGATKSNLRAQGTVTNVQTGENLHYVVRANSQVTGNGTDLGYDNNIQLTKKR